MITLTDIKTINRISGSTEDTFLNYTIPLVIESLCTYCKNYFLDKETYIKTLSATFAASDNSVTITDFDSEFAEGDYIRILETTRNNGHAYISDITGTKLTLTGITLVDEIVEDLIIIFKCDYPRSLKIPVAKIFTTLINNKDIELKREKIDDYEAEFVDGIGFLPKNIMAAFKNYKKLFWDEIYLYDY